MKGDLRAALVFAMYSLVAALIPGCFHPEDKPMYSWDKRAAATYLDQRQDWWTKWPGAARDHETFCVSCHTALPYALSRPALRRALAEDAPSLNERRLLDNVTKRVRLWKKVAPFYSDA